MLNLCVFVLPDLVFSVNTCLHSGAKLQLSFTNVTGIFHKLKRVYNIVKAVVCVSIICVCICLCGNVTHLEVRVVLSDVRRKCSCVRVTWPPLSLTVTNGKPFCDVHELIISDTFWCCAEISTWAQEGKSRMSVAQRHVHVFLCVIIIVHLKTIYSTFFFFFAQIQRGY